MQTAGRALTWPDRATGHFVRFYHAESLLVDEVVDFAREALYFGGCAILIATRAHLSAMMPRLAELGPVRDGASKAGGGLVSIDAEAALAGFMVDGWPDEARFFATIGSVMAKASVAAMNGPVHAFGEMVAVLCEAGQYDAALRVEALWNALALQHSFTLFCAYPHALFPNAEQSRIFEHICRAHKRVLPSEVFTHAKESDTHRLIAQWQQKAAALQVEMERRRDAETALRRRERELVDFVTNAPVAAALLGGSEHVFRLANRRYRELAGCADPIGRPYAEVCASAQHDRQILDLLAKTYKSGRSFKCDEHRVDMTRPDGAFEPRYFTFHFEPLRSDGEAVDGVIVIAVEVTEQVRTRDRFEKSHDERERLVRELEQASRAKDEFLAMLGHELRNPLSPIVTALQLMRMRSDGCTSHEQGIIARQVDHLVRLVDDLLDISRITRGKIELKKRTVRVAEVLTNAVEIASLLLEQRRHQLTVDIEPDLVWTVDATRLAQVVSNLLTNAARYTAVGGQIRLAAWREAGDRERIAVSVRDNGVGIPKKMVPRVFDLFYQGRRSLDRAEGGLGIGLALVKNLVEMHGGTVSAASAGPGRGSEFTIRVPAAPVAREGAGAASDAVAREALRAESPAPNGRRVLLVDDNVDGVEALSLLLSECGHQVKAVYDPASALQIVRRLAPEIAVVDIGLPVMDGYQLIGRLRGALAGRRCVFVALTGYGQDADRSRSREAGFDHHFVKPVDPSQLLRLIGELPPRA